MSKGDVPIFQAVEQYANDPTIAISTQCGKDNEDRYKEAISFCDYLYSDEGMILKSFGVEGETFVIEKDDNGEEHFVYTDKVKNYEEFGATNMSAALYHFMLPANHPGFSQHPDYLNGYYELPRQKEALEVWNKYVDEAKKHIFPGSSLTYTEDESAEIANIQFVAKNNLISSICDIILGKASIDTYDKAIEVAKKAGYDKLLKINQAAYDRCISIVK
jgi:putative aldouronate transport system substrate-binding protein